MSTSRSPRRARPGRHRAAGLALAVVALLAPACDAVGDAVDGAQSAVGDAREAVEEGAQLVQFCTAALRVAQAVADEDVDKAVSAGEDMVANAPDEIAPEARTVLEGAREAQGGDPSALQTSEFRQAADAVQQFTTDRCDPR